MTRRRTLSIAFDGWPQADRERWRRALAPAEDLFDEGGGAGERFSERTLRKWAEAYATWLSFLERRGELEPASSPAARVTPARLDAWIDEQRAREVRNSTIHYRLVDLHHMLRLIEPGAAVEFIVRPRGTGLRRALPPVPKPFTIVESQQLLARALELFEAGRRGEGYAGGAAAIRDAALLGLLAAHPPRVGSVAVMRIGTHIIKTVGGYALAFEPPDTKNRKPLAFDLHPALVPVFDTYIESARPRLGSRGTDRLWCGTKGCPLGLGGVSKIVFRRTRDWFGTTHGPHWFRKCFRSTAARHSPEAALDAAVVLGHGPEVSVRHYTEAGGAAALRRHGQRITRLRRRMRLLAERHFAEREKERPTRIDRRRRRSGDDETS